MNSVLIIGEQHPKVALLKSLLNDNIEFVSENSIKLPQVTSSSYAHEILDACLTHNIHTVLPLISKAIMALSESKVLFEEYGIEVLALHGSEYGVLRTALEEHFAESKPVKSFSEFSKLMLELGYPNDRIAIGELNGLGNLIEIDDSCKDPLNIWCMPGKSSFIQLNKLFSKGEFNPVTLYKLFSNEKIEQLDFLLWNKKIDEPIDHEKPIVSLLLNKFKELKIYGFFEITLCGSQIVRIKTQQIC